MVKKAEQDAAAAEAAFEVPAWLGATLAVGTTALLY